MLRSDKCDLHVSYNQPPGLGQNQGWGLWADKFGGNTKDIWQLDFIGDIELVLMRGFGGNTKDIGQLDFIGYCEPIICPFANLTLKISKP